MSQMDSPEITRWIYYTTPDAQVITWDEAAAQLAAYVNQQNFVQHKTHARRIRRFSTEYPSVLHNYERLPLTIRCPPGRQILHIPVMPLSRFSDLRGKVDPGSARLVYVEGIYDAFDIIYHDSTKPKHKWATYSPYSMAEKALVPGRGHRGTHSSPVTFCTPNRFAGLAARADNIL